MRSRYAWLTLTILALVAAAGRAEPPAEPKGLFDRVRQAGKGFFSRGSTPAQQLTADPGPQRPAQPGARQANYNTPAQRVLKKSQPSKPTLSPARTSAPAGSGAKRPRTISEYMAQERP